MARKYEAIDLMKLHAKGSNNGWNAILTKHLQNQNIDALAVLNYRICAGMDDLAKKKLNTAEINDWFVRLTMSIEKTAKAIIRQRHPMPQDSGLVLQLTDDDKKMTAAKKARDKELQDYFKKSRY